nr:hypothetical protein Iba_chr12dCG8310 [Ipomoea batatas]
MLQPSKILHTPYTIAGNLALSIQRLLDGKCDILVGNEVFVQHTDQNEEIQEHISNLTKLLENGYGAVEDTSSDGSERAFRRVPKTSFRKTKTSPSIPSRSSPSQHPRHRRAPPRHLKGKIEIQRSPEHATAAAVRSLLLDRRRGRRTKEDPGKPLPPPIRHLQPPSLLPSSRKGEDRRVEVWPPSPRAAPPTATRSHCLAASPPVCTAIVAAASLDETDTSGLGREKRDGQNLA